MLPRDVLEDQKRYRLQTNVSIIGNRVNMGNRVNVGNRVRGYMGTRDYALNQIATEQI